MGFLNNWGKSFMKIRNNNGPKCDPWRTSEGTGNLSEVWKDNLTIWKRFQMYDDNHDRKIPLKPLWKII